MTAPPPVAATAARSAPGLLVDRTFGPFFWGNLVSNCGTWFQNIAAGIVVYRLTGSALLVGVVSVTQFAATLVLSPYAGAVTDRVDRRRLLLGGQLVSAAGAAGLAAWTALVGVEGLPGPWPVFAATLVIGLGYAFSIPAMQALVPALVGRSDLDQAIALNSVTFNLARAVGPALAAATLAAAGAATAFAVNTATYLALIAALLVIRPHPVERPASTADGSVRAGLRYVRGDPTIALLLVAVTALGFGSDPVNTLTPSLADRLDGGDALVALLVSAFGGGAAATTFVMGRLRRRVGLPRLARLGFLLLGGGMVSAGLVPTAPLAAAAFAVAGSGFLCGITALTTAIQQRVSEGMRGRVMALWGVAFLGSRPVAAVVDGSVADLTSVSLALGVTGAIALSATFLVRAATRREAADVAEVPQGVPPSP